MTKNIRPELISVATEIVSANLQGQGSLSELCRKEASERNYSDNLIPILCAETNKQMILKTGSQEFQLADPEIVLAGISKYASEDKVEVVPYSFPEFSIKPNQIINTFSKSASSNKASLDITKAVHEVIGNDLNEIKIKTASVKSKMNSLFNEISNSVNSLKSHGFNFDDVKTKAASLDSNIIEYCFNDKTHEVNEGFKKFANLMRFDFEKLASVTAEFNKLNDEQVSLQAEENRIKALKSGAEKEGVILSYV